MLGMMKDWIQVFQMLLVTFRDFTWKGATIDQKEDRRIKALEGFEQSICDELAARTGQRARWNDGNRV
jgi:hypothetical protein